MLSVGDIQGCLRRLETLLRVIKYPGYVDYSGLSKGEPSAFLPLVSFALTSFSPPLAEQLMADGLELTGKTDLRFTDTLYKVLRDVFHYKPILTKQQFLQWGFSQRKISFICDIINLVLQKHNQLKKPKVRCPASHKDSREETQPTSIDAAVSESPTAAKCIENPSVFPTNSYSEALTSHNITYTSNNNLCSSTFPEKVNKKVEDMDNTVHLSEMERRLSALEAQLGSLLSGLDRLSILEKRLEELERRGNTNKYEEHVITISRESWENLMSRVLLLETKLELNNQPSKEDLKDRLESITNMLKSTSSLLKNTESFTPTANKL
ncbi:centrosomal protein of 44 kDa [Anabas testudineus]|uniref:Centrosomal protein of 44 kDa n=2 Tax=Anabas testudineus TaxID=64144 RepID=A0AAQ6ICC2_ANATE|nr:centrosomal protein of 44 kDa [Anabas testudineus]